MSKLLTLFIPSYNRAKDLDRALTSIYASIESGRCAEEVEVLVVDDHSTEDIALIAAKYRDKTPPLIFKLHAEKCGVAEAAMLRGLRHVATPYVWVVGNDDMVTIGSIRYALEIIADKKPGFCLFNFVAERRSRGSVYEIFASVSDVVTFETGERFFMNFGVVTSTTTFPCLCFEVAPLLQLDLERVIAASPIYSHTAAFYVAFFKRRCCFVNRIMAVFNHNEAMEEHDKLVAHNERMGRIPFYNWTIGLMRHLDYMSAATGVSLEALSLMSEDESLKDSHVVKKTLLVYFIVRYLIDQITQETRAARVEYCTTVHMTAEDVEACESFLSRCGAFGLLDLFKRAKIILVSSVLSTEERLARLHRLAQELVDTESEKIASIEREKRAAFDRDPSSFDVMVRYANSGYKVLDSHPRRLPADAPEFVRLNASRLMKASGAGAELPTDVLVSRYAKTGHGPLPFSARAVAAQNSPDLVIFNNSVDRVIFSKTFGDSPKVPAERSSSEIAWARVDLSLEEVGLKMKSHPTIKPLEIFANASSFRRPDITVRSPVKILFINHACE